MPMDGIKQDAPRPLRHSAAQRDMPSIGIKKIEVMSGP